MAMRIRIISGLVLFAFATMHLINVALGLHSIALMDRANPFLMGPWTSTAGGMILFACLAAHFALGLAAIYRRNTLRLSPIDAVQLLAALAIVPLLTPHVVGTAIAGQFGIRNNFSTLIPYFWIDAPSEGLRQVLLLAFLWIHGCVGVFTWMRIQRWWRRIGGFLYPLAVAVPVLGMLGFVQAGKEAIARLADPAAFPPLPAPPPMELTLPFDEILAILSRINWTVFIVYLAVIAGIFIARAWRLSGERRHVRIAFVGGPVLDTTTGLNILESARLNHVPIANLCRGRGRCGTCRVRILEASAQLAPPSASEAGTLARLGAPPDVRLACQFEPPAGTFRVERLLSPFMRPRELHQAAGRTPDEAEPWRQTQHERRIAFLALACLLGDPGVQEWLRQNAAGTSSPSLAGQTFH
jgi:adenylate cyclase